VQAPGLEDDRPDEPRVVARGDWATLHSAAGAVTLESRVEVLQDGRPGQRVRVRQQGATGPVFARVLGAGQLELVP
jgi:flagella basal body P-ring formation protein FlgA